MRWFLGNPLCRLPQRTDAGSPSVYNVFTLARQSVMVPKVVGTDLGIGKASYILSALTLPRVTTSLVAVKGLSASKMTAENLEGRCVLSVSSSNDDNIRVSGGNDIPVAQSSGLGCSKESHTPPVGPSEI